MNNMFPQIEKLIKDNDIVLFMKGTREMPQCGFSATVVQILNKLGANFIDVDILRDTELRQAIKEFSDWPTVPQLYIKGEFIGGCDIAREMYQNGDLKNFLHKKGLIK